MVDLHLELKPQTALKLKRVLDLHPDQETFARNVITYQIMELNKAILNLHLDLKAFEEKYHRTSADFYTQFTRGEMDDSEDYILWAGLYEMLIENQTRLASLQ
jgi:hypothetical protein